MYFVMILANYICESLYVLRGYLIFITQKLSGPSTVYMYVSSQRNFEAKNCDCTWSYSTLCRYSERRFYSTIDPSLKKRDIFLAHKYLDRITKNAKTFFFGVLYTHCMN